MGVAKKLYDKIKGNPKNVKFEDIEKLLVVHGGFRKREAKGSHAVYKHDSLTGIKEYITIPRAKPVKSIYIKKALLLFEKVVDIEEL